MAGAPPEELADENGAVDEAVAEEALAEGVSGPDGNDGLVEEALAPGDPVAESEAALEPAAEAAEPAALAADESVEGEEPS